LTSLSSIIAHHRRQAVWWKTVGQLAPGLLAGAVLGAFLATALDASWLTLVFAGFAMLAGFQLLLSPAIHGEKALPGKAGSSLVGIIIGAVSSLVGIGGGSMTAPWLMWHGVRAQNAVATAAACGYPIALAGTATFIFLGSNEKTQSTFADAALGFVHGPAWMVIAVTGALAAPLGAATVHRLSPHLVKRLFGVALVLIAIRLAVLAL
jgi:uncharacterized membrane protein YfcA